MEYLKEKIFLAGGTGMAGSAIKRELIAQGYGCRQKGGEILSPTKKELNLSKIEDVFSWFNKNQPSIVIIAAAKVGGIFANSIKPADFLLENSKIQNNLIEAAFKNKVKKLIFLGSSCIYPKLSPQPIKEEFLMQSNLEQTNEAYAIAKISGIKLCEYLRRQYGFNAISLMPTNLYGPNDNYDSLNSHVMASLIRKFCDAKKLNKNFVNCWGTGKPLREFMHVDDLAKAVIFCLENWTPDLGEIVANEGEKSFSYINVGTGKDISIKDLAIKIALLTKFKGEIIWDKSKPDGTPRKLLDVNRLNNLGWKASIKLEDGIKNTIRDYMIFHQGKYI